MPVNASNGVELTLSDFNGLVSEISPNDLPDGVSPACSNMQFKPGGTMTRPGLQKLYATTGETPWVYEKSYIQPNGQQQNLVFDASGKLWVENVTTNPGVLTMLLQSTPGALCKSLTAFGSEYIAISDGLHGQEVPLQWDGTKLRRVTHDGPGANLLGVQNVAIPAQSISSIYRASNVVGVITSAAHGLQVGYQVQIAGVPSYVLPLSITSIVINNEDNPGIATVTTSVAHNLAGTTNVSITGVAPSSSVSISTLSRIGQVVTVVTSTNHKLSPGATITVAGTTATSGPNFDTTTQVLSIIDPTSFTFSQVSADGAATGGVFYLDWPIQSSATPSTFEVVSAPSTTTFKVLLNYADGNWYSGSVSVAFDGYFYVSAVPNTTSFTYQQYAPNALEASVGTATPFGQISPGKHQVQVLFQTDEGAITAPSAPSSFIANGGQYLTINNIPIGPGDVVARILAFSGSLGSQFYYIAVPAQLNSQIVSTATVLNDNTSTSMTVDFSDNTLYDSLGISIPGNTLANQIVLDGCLGFASYASRLMAYGCRNRVQNLQNMSFDGGSPGSPIGWTPLSGTGSYYTPAGRLGIANTAFQMTFTNTGTASVGLQQSFYRDVYGVAIAKPNQMYTVRFFVKASVQTADPSQLVLDFLLSDTATGFSSLAVTNSAQMTTAGNWVEAKFTGPTPAVIPAGLKLSLYCSLGTAAGITSASVTVDEISIIYSDNPYVDKRVFASYPNNENGFDGVSGLFGPSDDTHKIMNSAVARGTLYLLTQDPGGRLHEVQDSAVSEPAGWDVVEVGTNCGTVSSYGLTVSQASDSTASGGEEWFMWPSSSGWRIFGGDQPWKISQEIQPDWDSINPAGYLTIWGLNDPNARVVYIGLPIGTATTPNMIYTMDYRGLDSAYQIAQSPPVINVGGRSVANKTARKWCPWSISANNAALLLVSGRLIPAFLCTGNAYLLNSGKFTDDDFGQIYSFYTTYAFPTVDQEQFYKLGAQRKNLMFVSASASGIGEITFEPFENSLNNPWPQTGMRDLVQDPFYDLEWGGGNAQGQRIFMRLSSAPITGTDNGFGITKLTMVMAKDARIPIRGVA